MFGHPQKFIFQVKILLFYHDICLAPIGNGRPVMKLFQISKSDFIFFVAWYPRASAKSILRDSINVRTKGILPYHSRWENLCVPDEWVSSVRWSLIESPACSVVMPDLTIKLRNVLVSTTFQLSCGSASTPEAWLGGRGYWTLAHPSGV